MAQKDTDTDAALDALFAETRRADPIPSADLMARIMADATAVQAQSKQVIAPEPVPRRINDMLRDMFGGWAGVSTLAACAGLGLFFGFASPDVVLSYMPGTDLAAIDDTFGLYFDDEL